VSLRPARTRWFELLTTHADLTHALETLANTGQIELEIHQHARMHVSLQDMKTRLQVYTRLEQRYQSYWPKAGQRTGPFNASPGRILDTAILRLLDWERRAAPMIKRFENLESERADLQSLISLLELQQTDNLDFSLLTTAGDTVVSRLFELPAETCSVQLPASVISRQFDTPAGLYMLLVGTRVDLEALAVEMTLKKCHSVPLPRLPASRHNALQWVNQRIQLLDLQMHQQRLEISALEKSCLLAETLGDIRLLGWFLDHVSSLPVSDNFAWITGWTSDPDGEVLRRALVLTGADAILHFPPAPPEIEAPMVLSNPWWARPFELFAGLLGTPGQQEADPSRLLALLTPLLFGYMFADVGQGLVLLLAGIALRHRWPLLRILIANGFAAMVFGLVFGSVFGREDILPALWLHPVTQPLPVLAVPLAGGVLILLLGMALNGLEFFWRGERRRWLLLQAPIVLLYLLVVSALMLPAEVVFTGVALALLWYIVASLVLHAGRGAAVVTALAADLGALVETLLQLVLNTVSFVRIGAFALAHAGLSMAFNIMADATETALLALLVLLLGNVIVIALEGLVVSIQMTRLILFEFFIRFLQASGRVFRPLAGPAAGYQDSGHEPGHKQAAATEAA
jgi:V/A-type H+-transporting ATPase subunit I